MLGDSHEETQEGTDVSHHPYTLGERAATKSHAVMTSPGWRQGQRTAAIARLEATRGLAGGVSAGGCITDYPADSVCIWWDEPSEKGASKMHHV